MKGNKNATTFSSMQNNNNNTGISLSDDQVLRYRDEEIKNS